MNVELINIGSELMLGRVLNTHQQWLCRRLADLGNAVTRQVAVADTGTDIETAVRESLSRAALVITTGGLGPTSDDITRDLIAQLLGRKLFEDARIVQHIEQFFAARKRPMPPSTRIQAMVPEGAIVLPNPHGTAPGLAIKVQDASGLSTLNPQPSTPQWLIMLPGPPRELRPMFNDAVVPLLQQVLPHGGQFICRTLRTIGMGESLVADQLEGPLRSFVQRGMDLGYCARVGQVDVRLVARGEQASEIVREAEQVVRSHIEKIIFGADDDELEAVVVRLLTERKQTLALAESCTGGGLANRITDVPGASAVLIASLVTYANEAKEKFLGVRPETLAAHGAVSEAVAREMVEGARKATGADYALSVTGIAGPGGGSEAKPVGTVFIGFASADKTVVLKQFNPFDRETFKHVTGTQALEMLRRKLID
ncbi:MAG TPA: competence/damage-inducible protein A [Verrucomicrobiae bacterium]|nr:competence/damage-inducible protein A [Verrucomicrobiae bacterium]